MWGSKPKAKVYSGFMGDTSPEQEAVLAQFKEFVKATGSNEDGKYDDYDFLRFCRARKFVLADIQTMWKNHMEWRVKRQCDKIYQEWTFEEEEKVFEIYPQFYHKTDKLGRPIYIE